MFAFLKTVRPFYRYVVLGMAVSALYSFSPEFASAQSSQTDISVPIFSSRSSNPVSHPMLLPPGRSTQFPPVYGAGAQKLGRPYGGKIDEVKALSNGKAAEERSLSKALANGNDLLSNLPAQGSDYLTEIAEGGYRARWSVLKHPITAYVDINPRGLQNFQAGFPQQVRKAMELWMAALGHQIQVVWVDRASDADIRVGWVNQIDTRGHNNESGTTYTAGITRPTIQNDQLQRMDVTLSTFDLRQKPQSSDDIFILALHELGHALGLRGHSKVAGDVMYAQPSATVALSRRDIATIRRLYSQPVEVTNLPPKTRDGRNSSEGGGNAAWAQVQKKLDQQLVQAEALVRQESTSLNYQNLGALYFQKGKLLQKDRKSSESLAFYQKALAAMSQGLVQEPKDAYGYANRAIVYRQLHQPASALPDLQRAISLNPKEATFYRQEAWVYDALKQPAEAKNALQEYLYRDPDGINEEEVKTLQKRLAY